MVEEDGKEAGSGDGGQADGGGGQASPCFPLRLRFRLRALFGLSPFRRLHPVNVGLNSWAFARVPVLDGGVQIC